MRLSERRMRRLGLRIRHTRYCRSFREPPVCHGWNEYYNHSNEPVHTPYVFVYAGKPWFTQKWVRRILPNAYHNDVNGIVGNDDVGWMSAWYVLGAMGFYPVCLGDNTY